MLRRRTSNYSSNGGDPLLSPNHGTLFPSFFGPPSIYPENGRRPECEDPSSLDFEGDFKRHKSMITQLFQNADGSIKSPESGKQDPADSAGPSELVQDRSSQSKP
jgi:hypothetical protein